VTRLADIWAAGEAGASLGFATARLFDELDPLERIKDKLFAEQKLSGRAQTKALSKHQQDALELLRLSAADPATRDAARFEALSSNSMVHFAILDTQANVLCPACKLWNTGHGATMMREAVSLMGGYGVTEDCPGFLGQKWADAQLEATYEGPEAVQRLQMSITMTNELFLAQFKQWIADLKTLSVRRPGTGACALGTAMKLWLWSLNHLQKTADPQGGKLYQKSRQSVTFPMADALCWLLSARQFILDTIELEEKGPANPALAEGLPGTVAFFTDLCQVQSARTAGEVGRICAELVFGYGTHPTWPENCDAACQTKTKAGPCVEVQGTLAEFAQLRAKLDSCLTGSRAAKDRAAESLTKVMIPEALDYPM